MDNKKLKILLLGDNQDYVLKISNILKDQNIEFELALVNTKAKYERELTGIPPEIILIDDCLTTFSSTDALGLLKALKLDIPFILLGNVEDDAAVLILKSGANDYFLRDRLQRLPNAVLSAVQKCRTEKLLIDAELKIKENEDKYTSLIQHLPTNIALLNHKGIIVDVNTSWKLFADENGFTGSNYAIGTNYIELARQSAGTYNEEGILIAEAIEKISDGKLNNFSLIYPCHSPDKKRWFKVIASQENEVPDSRIIIMHVDVTEEQEAKLKAQQSEANFLSIFNNTDIAFTLLDNSLKVISANKIANLLANTAFGISTLEGHSLISLLSVRGNRLLKLAVKRVTTGISLDEEVSYLMLDDSTKWFRVRMNRVTDDKSIVTGFCLSVADVTGQVMSRKKIEESEIRFKSIAEQASDGIILKDVSDRFVFVNQAFCSMIGYTEKELLQMHAHDLSNREESKDEMDKSVSKPKPLSINRKELKCKDKSIISVDATEKVIKINEIDFVLEVSSNVTNQIRNELALIKARINAEENEAKLVEAQKAAKVGNWETELNNLTVTWSEETYKIFELDSNTYQPTHESFLNFVHPSDRTIVSSAFVNSFKSRDYNFIEHRILTSKGTLKYVEERWKTIFDSKGLPISTFGTCQDITERKIVEQELINTKIKAEENEFRLRLAADSAKLGVWDWDIRENVLTWDDNMFSLFGISRKANTNKFESWTNCLHPEDRELAIDEVNAALKGDRNFDTSFRIVKPNGSIAFIKADGVVLCDMYGNSARMIGINRDITEQKLADEKLINSKKRLIKILQNSPIASCLGKLDTSVIFFNNQFTNLFGYTITDVPNLDQWWMIAYPDEIYREVIKKELFARIEHYQVAETHFVPMESKVRCKDGSYRFIEFYYARIDDEFFVNFNDITERIKHEEQLALSDLIINSIDDAIISRSLDGKVTSWNRGAEKLFGYKAHEIIGKSTDILKTCDVLEAEEKEVIAKVNMGESVYHYETKRKKKDGEQIDVSLTVSSILDARGKVSGVSKILRDITYQKSMELEREKTINNLLQRNRDLEQFSKIISHNIRGPVATILGLTNLMNGTKLSAMEKKKIMGGLSSSVNNLDSVIKDLNDILQVKAQSNEKRKLILFSDLLNDVELSLSDQIQNEHVQILSNFDAIKEVVTLEKYMYSIFYNLISNSIKYRQPNVQPIIEIKNEVSDKNLILTFKDNGIGIDLIKHGHEIFGLNKRFNFNVEGKGLGLFMVKTQLESLGGKISIESELDKGSEFKIELENYIE